MPLFASYAIPLSAPTDTLVFAGAGRSWRRCCADRPSGIHRQESTCTGRRASAANAFFQRLDRLAKPKTAIGCVVRIINTAPQNGFVVFLPIYFTETIGFELGQWLRLLSFMFLSNIIWNLLFGFIGDRLGWRRTVAYCGGVGSAVTTLLLYYAPHTSGPATRWRCWPRFCTAPHWPGMCPCRR